MDRIKARLESFDCAINHCFSQRPWNLGSLGLIGLLLDELYQACSAALQLVASIHPRIRDGCEYVHERGHTEAGPGGEVGATIEWATVGCGEDRHGPAAALCKSLHCAHIDAIEVWPLLPIHLDAHEMLIEECSYALILEGLVGHHVAPVAGRIADGEKDRLVLFPGFVQRRRPPGVPIHRIVRMLEQVRARFVGQMIGHGVSLCVVERRAWAAEYSRRASVPIRPTAQLRTLQAYR